MTTDGGKEGTFKKTNNDNGVFLLLHKLSFYNKWNVKLFCLIKNLISFNFFFFSRRLASGLQRCRRQPILATVFIRIIIP